MDLSLFQKERILLIDAVQEGRQKPLKILDANKFELDEQLINTIHKALSLDIDSRFKSADEFLKALNGEIKVLKLSNEDKVNTSLVENTCVPVRKVGKGFADVAGIVDLKVQLQSDVIVLRDAARRSLQKNLPKKQEFIIDISNVRMWHLHIFMVDKAK